MATTKKNLTRINTSHTRGDAGTKMLANLMAAPIADHGIDWYLDQRNEIRDAADRLGIRTDVLTAVVAHVSPQLKWNKNLSYAFHIASLFKCGGTLTMLQSLGMSIFPDNLVKAWDVLTSDNPKAAKFGPKTGAFYANLMGDKSHVTVDRHHAMIMLGKPVPGDVAISEAAYRDMAAITRTAAAAKGMTPADFQAGLWVARRDALGIFD